MYDASNNMKANNDNNDTTMAMSESHVLDNAIKMEVNNKLTR